MQTTLGGAPPRGARPRSPIRALTAGALVVIAALALPFAADAAPKERKAAPIEVMTRNLFLGADLGPAISAASPEQFVAANGAILRQVSETDFPRRAVALGAEIRRERPDLVGLQEVALWRTGPVDPLAPILGPSATEVRFDFLELLLAEANKGKQQWRAAVVQEQFDFEGPADEDPGQPGPELNGRLTMRDVILVRDDKRIEVTGALGGNFDSQLVIPDVAGIVDISVTRGWTAVDVNLVRGKKAKVRQSFRLVNTHLEAFDDETAIPSIRAQQAAELVAPGGPAAEELVILLGDLNSDSPGVKPGDEQAFELLLDAGFVRRSTTEPASCCVNDLFTAPATQFDHVVDHVLTNRPGRVKQLRSSVVGLEPVGGIYPSDHAGVVSKLLLRR